MCVCVCARDQLLCSLGSALGALCVFVSYILVSCRLLDHGSTATCLQAYALVFRFQFTMTLTLNLWLVVLTHLSTPTCHAGGCTGRREAQRCLLPTLTLLANMPRRSMHGWGKAHLCPLHLSTSVTSTCMQADALAGGKHNVAFLGLFLLGRLGECVDLLVSTSRCMYTR